MGAKIKSAYARRALLGIVLQLASTAAFATSYVPGSQNVSGSRSTPKYTDNGTMYGPYGWNYSYVRSFDGTKLTKDVEINFVFDAGLGYTAAQQAAYKAAAKANIESVWNNKFKITDNANNMMFPVGVNMTTTGPFNQTVTIKSAPAAGDPPYDMTDWYTTQDSAGRQAHEFGHMLGLFDEYIGGAVDQYPNPTLSNDGVMGLGANSASPVMYPRYYQQFLDYMNTINPSHNFSLTAVPEPSLGALLFLAMAGSALRRRRQMGRAV